MLNDFSAEYSERTDDELLHLASQRHFLTTEARISLDAELSRRNLTEADRIEHQRFVKRQEQRDAKKHRRKPFGPFKYQLSWHDIVWAFAAVALISFSYLALPSRYHMKSDWQDAAFIVMMTSVLIAIASRSVFWRNFAFWMSLIMSSAIHLVLVHSWTRRLGDLSRNQGRGAALLGFVLFLAIYGFVRLLQRMFHREGDQTTHSGEGHVLE